MEEKFIPKLTGGTFFYLLLQAKRRGISKSQYLVGEKDGISETNMLIDLMQIAKVGHFVPATSTLKNNTSLFKSCEKDYTMWLCFDDKQFINEFDIKVKTDYLNLIKTVCEFTQKYFELERDYVYKHLGQQLLTMIKKDETIDEETLFYLSSGIEPICKKDIDTNSKYSLQGIILGIWHYIITNEIKNSDGKETYKKWSLAEDTPISKNIDHPYNLALEGRNFIIYSFSASDSKLQPEYPKTKIDTSEDVILSYLTNVNEKYKALKTLFYTENPHNFYDFYVCNNLSYRGRFFAHRDDFPFHYIEDDGPVAKNSTAVSLFRKFTNYVLITGTGGLGKSMMMRHLLLNSVEEYSKYKMIPLFVTLKDYSSNIDLIEFIYNNIKGLFNISIGQLKTILSDGQALILLDGLDEIKIDHLAKFEKELELLTDKYSTNMFVLSSRPFQKFVSLSRFHEFRVCPFTKEQALSLISKLEFRPDEPQIKQKFYDLLASELYYSHKEFAMNPLLLTIMLMTFEQYAEVPQKMHIFYREAYLTLSQKHDAVKGAYKRTLKTGLTAERFMDYLAEFCCRTYRDEKFEFSFLEGQVYFSQLKEHERYSNEHITYADFIDDLQNGMCLLYYEGQKYHFTHRSFQEYFCALYFSKQKDKHLNNIGAFFETKKHRMRGDKTFSMLHDMIPDKVEEYIFLPYLKKLLSDCEKKEGYLTFLSKVFPIIEYTIGDTDSYSSVLSPSYLYDYIANHYRIMKERRLKDLPFESEFVVQDYITLQLENGDYETVPIGGVCFENEDRPEPDGWSLEFKMKHVLKNKEDYTDLINGLYDDEFPLMKEYNAMIDLLSSLKQKLEDNNKDFLDFLD